MAASGAADRYLRAMPNRPVRRLLARLFLAATGWTPEGERPTPARFVLIAAPHTSNWDFPYLIAFAELYGVPISWIGKHTLFKWPFGGVMKALGGVPVRRDRRQNLVKSLAAVFDDHDALALVVPAEGTRGHVDQWKSGFYHIAREADVPIVLSFLDYERKVGGFGPAFRPTGDVRADMDRIRAFYADKQGKFPERFGEIRLAEESADGGGSASGRDGGDGGGGEPATAGVVDEDR